MKKLVFIIPLMAISLLASCNKGGGDDPGPTPDPPGPSNYNVIIPTFSGISITQTSVEPGSSLEATINIDNTQAQDKPQGLPYSLSNVTIGTKSLLPIEYEYKVNPGRESAIISIDSSKINGDITLDFLTTDLEWFENHYYLSSLKQSDILENDGVIQELTVNGLKHKVRLIGVGEDLDANSNTIHTTWEFMNLISDRFGNSLGTQWNNTDVSVGSNYDYLKSPIRKALNGTGDAPYFLWAEYEKGAIASSWSTTYVTSVLDMIDEGNPGFISILKAPKKTVMCKSDDGSWAPTEIKTGDDYDKLFLLSPGEMGFNGTQDKAYTYYGNCTKQTESKRIKKQFNEGIIETFNNEDNIPTLPVGAEGLALNYSGYNKEADWTGGGLFWSRSPGTVSDNTAWRISSRGMLFNSCPVNGYAIGVAPAFCI